MFFSRHMRDAAGSEDMAVNGSVTPVEFTLEPRAGEKALILSQAVITIVDTGNFDSGSYGNNVILTNGILVELVSDTGVVLVDLLDGDPVKTNPEWAQNTGNLTLYTFGSGDNVATIVWNAPGNQIILDANTILRVTIQDDLTGLSKHQIHCQGVVVG